MKRKFVFATMLVALLAAVAVTVVSCHRRVETGPRLAESRASLAVAETAASAAGAADAKARTDRPAGPAAEEPKLKDSNRALAYSPAVVPGPAAVPAKPGAPQTFYDRSAAPTQSSGNIWRFSGGAEMPQFVGNGPAPDGLRREQLAVGAFNTEAYDSVPENPFLRVTENPLSTFSIDVDTASYANVRRFLTQGTLPPKGAVRIEELVNYFPYDYAAPADGTPFAVKAEATLCPWSPRHRLVRVALKGREIDLSSRPASNLVFLLDVSGSMQPENKLPLVKRAMEMLADQLVETDRVAIVVYAGASGLALESTACTDENREAIIRALRELRAGGSTQGSAGIQLAYEIAAKNFIEGGTNRVILATDGDFNVGITNQSELVTLIEEKAKTKVFLSVLGVGEANLKDSTMEKLADKGNGNYAYIDTIAEANKALVEQMAGTLMTIAKDVKIQIEFNPAAVEAYRLVGYENRMLAKEDFNDDKKDAGEIGAGHCVTAFYEVVPAGEPVETPPVDALKYQSEPKLANAAASGEMLTVKLRYKEPEGDTSQLVELPVRDEGLAYAKASDDFRFAACVAQFGMLLRDSPHKGGATYDAVVEDATTCLGADPQGYRAEFVGLAKKARDLAPKVAVAQ